MQALLAPHFHVPILHTGQHYDDNMSGAFFEELDIPAPHYTLDMRGAKSHGEQTGRMMAGIEGVCSTVQPDAMLIYGDTNTTLSAALVAAKAGIPLFHIEAGIRGYNRQLPEEVNRIIADTFSTLLLCPTAQAVDNLRKEGIAHEGVHLTGDVMCDLLEATRAALKPPVEGPYYFATIHRPYNTDHPERMRRIVSALAELDAPVYFTLHPRTLARLSAADIDTAAYPSVHFIGPVGYKASLSYQAGAAGVITDSSGVQKEAYMLRRPCVTLRSETEWPETLAHGWNTLLFEEMEAISGIFSKTPGTYIPGLFGNGRAAEAIVRIIREYFERAVLTA